MNRCWLAMKTSANTSARYVATPIDAGCGEMDMPSSERCRKRCVLLATAYFAQAPPALATPSQFSGRCVARWTRHTSTCLRGGRLQCAALRPRQSSAPYLTNVPAHGIPSLDWLEALRQRERPPRKGAAPASRNRLLANVTKPGMPMSRS